MSRPGDTERDRRAWLDRVGRELTPDHQPLREAAIRSALRGMDLMERSPDESLEAEQAEWLRRIEARGIEAPIATAVADTMVQRMVQRERVLRGKVQLDGGVRALDGTHQIVAVHAARAILEDRAFYIQNERTGSIG